MYNGSTPQSPPVTYGSEAYGMFPVAPATTAGEAQPTFVPTPAYATTSLPDTPAATGGAGWAYQARQASHVENPPWTWVPATGPPAPASRPTSVLAIALRVCSVLVLVIIGG